jgi:hypothetical protein
MYDFEAFETSEMNVVLYQFTGSPFRNFTHIGENYEDASLILLSKGAKGKQVKALP